MKALVKSCHERGLWLENVAEPELGINDVRVRILLTGICGTDLHIYEWDDWAKSTVRVPTIIGHEFVGQITEVGSNVSDFHSGELSVAKGMWCVDAAATVLRVAVISALTPKA